MSAKQVELLIFCINRTLSMVRGNLRNMRETGCKDLSAVQSEVDQLTALLALFKPHEPMEDIPHVDNDALWEHLGGKQG